MPAHDAANESGPRSAWHALTDACAFAAEIAMLVLLVLSGTRIGSGLGLHITLAIGFPVVAFAFWGIWAAPTSRRRLDDPWRLAAQIILFVITAVLAAAAHMAVWGVIFAVVAVAVFVLTRVFPAPSRRPSARAAAGPRARRPSAATRARPSPRLPGGSARSGRWCRHWSPGGDRPGPSTGPPRRAPACRRRTGRARPPHRRDRGQAAGQQHAPDVDQNRPVGTSRHATPVHGPESQAGPSRRPRTPDSTRTL